MTDGRRTHGIRKRVQSVTVADTDDEGKEDKSCVRQTGFSNDTNHLTKTRLGIVCVHRVHVSVPSRPAPFVLLFNLPDSIHDHGCGFMGADISGKLKTSAAMVEIPVAMTLRIKLIAITEFPAEERREELKSDGV